MKNLISQQLNVWFVDLASNDESPCENIICYNGGYCVEDPRLPNGAECHCPTGYDGEFCTLGMLEFFILIWTILISNR